MGIDYNQNEDLLDCVTKKTRLTIMEGYIKPLLKSGLGVEIDVQANIKASNVICDWENPLWHYDDRSLAEY
jgi:galactonate dehydratase